MPLKLKFGCDPEVVLQDRNTGEFVSAHDLIPGTKFEPFPVKSGAIQVDGVAAEFNITPALNSRDFVSNIHTVLGELQSKVGDKYRLCAVPAVTFPMSYFTKLPEEVRTLGCNPDFNAWTGQVNDKPEPTVGLAAFGGHIHVGWLDKDVDPTDEVHVDDCRIIAKQLDYFLGAYSLMWDSDTQRRQIYGKAGAFRPKPYGMEYRPLSNTWLRSKALTTWVFDAAYHAVNTVIEGSKNAEDEFGDTVVDVINRSQDWWSEGNKKLSKLHKFTGLQMPPKIPVFDPVGNKKVMKVKAKQIMSYPNGKFYVKTRTGDLAIDSSGHTIIVNKEGFSDKFTDLGSIYPAHQELFTQVETSESEII